MITRPKSAKIDRLFSYERTPPIAVGHLITPPKPLFCSRGPA